MADTCNPMINFLLPILLFLDINLYLYAFARAIGGLDGNGHFPGLALLGGDNAVLYGCQLPIGRCVCQCFVGILAICRHNRLDGNLAPAFTV